MPWKSRVKPRDFSLLSVRYLFYSFKCLICIPCYTSMNLRGLTPLFGLSLLTTQEGLRHSRICCSSVFFNGDLGLSSSCSKSVTSFPLSSMFFFYLFLFLSFLIFLLRHFYIFRLEPGTKFVKMSLYWLPFFFKYSHVLSFLLNELRSLWLCLLISFILNLLLCDK